MVIKIIFFGDIVGRIGRTAVEKIIPDIKTEYQPDLIIANAENLSGGKGVSEKSLKQMMDCGIDFFTSGNHVFDKSSAIPIFQQDSLPIIRPANYPEAVPGSGYKIIEIGTKKICIINLVGRVFFREHFDCPFKKAEQILKEIENQKLNGIIVDFHAEATSEKQAMMNFLDSKVSALFGTHTHVQTADEQVTDLGTAYISDIGMVGAKYGIIGVNKDEIIKNFLTQLPVKQEISETGTAIINAVYLELESDSKKAIVIRRIIKQIEI